MLRILFAVVGITLFALASGPAFARQEKEQTVEEQLMDVRRKLDEEYERVGSLQNHLDEAEKAKNDNRVKFLQKDIEDTWKVIDELKQMEEYLVARQEKEAGKGGRPTPPVRAGGARPFDRDTSTGSPDEKEPGIISDVGIEDEAESRSEIEKRPRPKDGPARPDRAGGPGSGGIRGGSSNDFPAPGDRGDLIPEESPKLRSLRQSYEAMVNAGEMELAEKIMIKIRAEEKRLKDERQEQEQRAREQREKERRNPKRGGFGGPPLAGSDDVPSESAANDRLRELEERLKKLEEENRRLKEEREKDGDGD